MVDREEITAEEVSVPVVRDTSFVRFVADKAIIAPLGRNVEVAFLQFGPMHRHISTIDEKFEGFESDFVHTEVARMRIGFQELVTFAMSFIRGGVVDGRLNGEAIRSTLDEWIAEASEQEGAVSSDD